MEKNLCRHALGIHTNGIKNSILYNSRMSSLADPDHMRVGGQRYALVSAIQVKDHPNKVAINIRGVFGSMDEAGAHAKKIADLDGKYDVFVTEMYNWAVYPPEVQDIKDKYYSDQVLQDIMKGYNDNQDAARAFYQQHKEDLMSGKVDPSEVTEATEAGTSPEDK